MLLFFVVAGFVIISNLHPIPQVISARTAIKEIENLRQQFAEPGVFKRFVSSNEEYFSPTMNTQKGPAFIW